MDEWKPTNRLHFVADTGEQWWFEVMRDSDGRAYSVHEWDDCLSAWIEYTAEGGWTFAGRATPGGQCGTVTVEEV